MSLRTESRAFSTEPDYTKTVAAGVKQNRFLDYQEVKK